MLIKHTDTPPLAPEIHALLNLSDCQAYWSASATWVVYRNSRPRLADIHHLPRDASYAEWQAVLTELMA